MMKRSVSWVGVAVVVVLAACSGPSGTGDGSSGAGGSSGGDSALAGDGAGGANVGGMGTGEGGGGRAGGADNAGRGGNAGSAVGGGSTVGPGGTSNVTAEAGGGTGGMGGMGGADSSAPRCGPGAPHCADPLSCVATYCVDCTNVKCPLDGDPVIVVDYQRAPDPAPLITLATTLERADVAFVLDTTGSMGFALANLGNSLVSTVTPAIQGSIPSPAFGVVSFKDFGETYVTHADYRIQTAATPAAAQSLQAVVHALTVSGGGDDPEAGWEALYAVTGGAAISVAGYSSSINLVTTPPSPVTAGEEQGLIPGLGFRQDALPIIVTVSDAEWHDAPGVAASGENGLNDYSATYAGAPSRAAVLARLLATGTRVIGLAPATSAKPRAVALATQSQAFVEPSDFGSNGVRPFNCSASQCCTGVNGVGEAPDANGHCPLAFTYDAASGSGVSVSVVNGVIALATGGFFDLSVAASDAGDGEISTFLARLELVADGSDGIGCLAAPSNALSDRFTGSQGFTGTDGVLDTIASAKIGGSLCVRVVPKPNTAIPRKAEPQFWSIDIQAQRVVTAMATLGNPKQITFMVPPL